MTTQRSQVIASLPGHRAMPCSTSAATLQWPAEDRMDVLGGEFQNRKTEFSQYAEAAARFKSQLADKTKDTGRKAAAS